MGKETQGQGYAHRHTHTHTFFSDTRTHEGWLWGVVVCSGWHGGVVCWGLVLPPSYTVLVVCSWGCLSRLIFRKKPFYEAIRAGARDFGTNTPQAQLLQPPSQGRGLESWSWESYCPNRLGPTGRGRTLGPFGPREYTRCGRSFARLGGAGLSNRHYGTVSIYIPPTAGRGL